LRSPLCGLAIIADSLGHNFEFLPVQDEFLNSYFEYPSSKPGGEIHDPLNQFRWEMKLRQIHTVDWGRNMRRRRTVILHLHQRSQKLYFHHASWNGQDSIVSLLLERGAEINLQDDVSNSSTPPQ
jgi:hypothetical protein